MTNAKLLAIVLGLCGALLFYACTPAERQAEADKVFEATNAYCDARQKALTELGLDGSPAIGIGFAGAAGSP
jgi:hypothetical protein